MPATLTFPGVYIHEPPSGVRTISAVSTSTALFIGSCADGPIDKPVLCLNYADFQRNFSDDVSADAHLPRFVKLFFLNGGAQAGVVRIAPGARTSQDSAVCQGPTPVLPDNARRASVPRHHIPVA